MGEADRAIEYRKQLARREAGDRRLAAMLKPDPAHTSARRELRDRWLALELALEARRLNPPKEWIP